MIKTKKITFRIEEEKYLELLKLAEKQDISISTLLRIIIKEVINGKEKARGRKTTI